MKKLVLTILAVPLLVAAGCAPGSDDIEEPGSSKSDVAQEATYEEPEMITTATGLRYQDLVVGEGVEAVDQMHVDCHYTLWLADSTGLVKGDTVDSSKDRGPSFQCQLGVGLISGWSQGMTGMKEGGTRRLYVPWELGYGERGAGAMIPGKSNLIFEIDFLESLDK